MRESFPSAIGRNTLTVKSVSDEEISSLPPLRSRSVRTVGSPIPLLSALKLCRTWFFMTTQTSLACLPAQMLTGF